MASIKTRIEIEGGEKVRADLKGIGEDGQASFEKVGKGARSLGDSLGRFRDRLQTIEKQTRSFGSALRDVADNAVDFGRKLGEAAKGFAVLGAAAGAAIKATANQADEQTKAAQSAGTSTLIYGRLAYAFKQAGVEASGTQKLFNSLNKSVDGTDQAASKIRTAWQGLGVSASRLGNGLVDTEKLIEDIAEAFSKMPDGAEKSRLAMELFGDRGGAKLIPFLNQGRKGIRELGDEAARLGIVFDDVEGKSAEAFNDKLDKLVQSFAGLRNAFAVPFLQPFANAFSEAAEIVAKFQPAINDISNLIVKGLVGAFGALRAVVVPVLNAVGAALDWVIKKFNEVFGTELTKEHLIVVAAFVAITAVVVKLAVALGAMFPVLSGVVKLFTGIPAILSLVTAGVKLLGSTFIALVKGVGLAIQFFTMLNPATLAIVAVIALVAAAVYLLIRYWPQLSAAALAAWNTISTGAADMWAKVKEYWNAGVAFFKSLFTAEFWAEVWESAKQAAFDAWEAIKAAFQSAFDAIWRYLENTWLGKVISAIGKAIDKAKELWNWLQKTGSAAPGAAGGGEVRAAGGGYIRGPGSGTSDSISARLSNGEFVQRAAAVRHYGVDFMRALNSLKLPRFDGFSMGGLVGDLMPAMPVSRFAEGGLVGAPAGGGGRPVVLQMPDGQSFSLMGDDGTVENLTRYANRQTIRAAGRKPVWFKG